MRSTRTRNFLRSPPSRAIVTAENIENAAHVSNGAEIQNVKLPRRDIRERPGPSGLSHAKGLSISFSVGRLAFLNGGYKNAMINER